MNGETARVFAAVMILSGVLALGLEAPARSIAQYYGGQTRVSNSTPSVGAGADAIDARDNSRMDLRQSGTTLGTSGQSRNTSPMPVGPPVAREYDSQRDSTRFDNRQDRSLPTLAPPSPGPRMAR